MDLDFVVVMNVLVPEGGVVIDVTSVTRNVHFLHHPSWNA